MTHWTKAGATQALQALAFNATNQALARYWLSLWDGDRPPTRGAINPARIKEHLPGVAIIACRAGESMHCRLAGSAIGMGLGMDITGKDMLALTPSDHRRARLARTSRVVEGAISRRRQHFRTRFGARVLVEDLQLPLSGLSEDGAGQALCHADWRPATLDRTAAEIVDGWAMADDIEYSALLAI